MLRARCHFCFYSNLPLELVSLVFFCVEKEIQKKKLSKDKKNHNQKHKREHCCTLRFSTVFCTRERVCVSARSKRAVIAKLSLVLLRLFFFRRSILFHHKDRYILERVLFFSDLVRVFFPPLPPQKKGEANFSSVFQRGWAATNAPRQNFTPTFTSGCE